MNNPKDFESILTQSFNVHITGRLLHHRIEGLYMYHKWQTELGFQDGEIYIADEIWARCECLAQVNLDIPDSALV